MKVCRLLVSFIPALAGDLRRNGTEQKKGQEARIPLLQEARIPLLQEALLPLLIG